MVDCARCLDEMGVKACGHQAMQQGMFFKIFTSCRPNQKATLHRFVEEGICFDDNSICCYTVKNLSDSQTTYGCDFTQTFCMQIKGPTASCQIPSIPARCAWKWVDIVNIDSTKRPANLVNLVRGKDKGRKAWHYVLIEKDLEEDFSEKVATGTVNVAEYGHVIESGWGDDPPSDLVNNLKKYSPQYF